LSLVVNPGPNWPRMIEMLDATASEKRKQFAFLPVWFTLSHHNLYLVHGHVF
jgi:anthranilate/para-aminobenzoate synthase component II